MAWSTICRPKDLGGLGILNLDRFGGALRLRRLWHERTSRLKPWIGLPMPCSPSNWLLFEAATFVMVKDGTTTSFWRDSWLFGEAPFVTAPELFKLSRRKGRTVKDVVHGGRWVKDLAGRLTSDLISSFVRLWARINAAPALTNGPDEFTWKLI